jgi:putative ABC transport system permease protein
MGRFFRKFFALFRRSGLEHDLDDELAFHLAMREAEQRKAGVPPEDAGRAARRQFGNVLRTKEQAREAWVFAWLESVVQDSRFAIRALRRSPAFTAVAVLTLGIGIGATTAIYSVVDTILVRPLPFSDSERLVRIVENVPRAAGRPPLLQQDVIYQTVREWRAQSRTLTDIAAYTWHPQSVRTKGGIVRLWEGVASANAFTLLGTRALLGRTFEPGDQTSPNLVVLAFDTWRRVFDANPGVLGTTIEVQPSGRLLTVIGVMPTVFEFPAGPSVDFYTPFMADDSPRQFSTAMIGRLGMDVPLKAAIDEAAAIAPGIPARNANVLPPDVPRFEVQPLKDQAVRELRPALRVFLATVGVVLLIVCANVANLLLARGTARQREWAMRVAIGASRGRVIRHILTETLILAFVGGVVGALAGAFGIALVKELASLEAPGIFRIVFGTSILPRANELRIDTKMFGIALSIAALTSFLFGALPAVHLSGTTHLHAIGSRRGGLTRRSSRLSAALVVGQVVMATVLLVGAGLLTHSFINLSTIEKGYDPSNVLTFQLVLPNDYSISQKTTTLETLLQRLREMPDVQAAGFSRHGILIPEHISFGTFVPEGQALDELRSDPAARPALRSVSHGYLTAAGIRLLEGREFQATDTAAAPPVIVISRTVARRYFGAQSAVGHFVVWHGATGKPAAQMQVVGVIEDVRNESPDREATPEVFVEYRQLLALQQRWSQSPQQQDGAALGFLSFAVHTKGNPASVAPTVREILSAVDANAGLEAMLPLDRLLASAVARPRFYAVILSVFSAVAGFLAAIGIYGMLAYAVTQRTQEIGVRMALGAQRAQVMVLVVRNGLALTAIGIGLGLVGAVISTRFLGDMLFGVRPLDATTFGTVAGLFAIVAMIAIYIPAHRATKVDPLVALRCE